MNNGSDALQYPDNGSSKQSVYALDLDEAEEEVDSLFRETTNEEIISGKEPLSGRNSNVRHRQSSTMGDEDYGIEQRPTFLGLVRSRIGTSVTVRALALLMSLVLLSVAVMQMWNQSLEDSLHDHLEHKTHHGPSFGGSQNPLHYNKRDDHNYHDDFLLRFEDDSVKEAFSSASYDDDAYRDEALPKSNVGQGVQSISSANRANEVGHYLHDPFRSPYASPLYATSQKNKTIQTVMQEHFQYKMKRIGDQFGRWQTPLADNVIVPHHEDTTLTKVPYMDWTSFSEKSWQTNDAYLGEYLNEAKHLVARVKEGIYTEYGLGIKKEHSEESRNRKIARRKEEFRVIRKRFRVGDNGTAFDPVSERRIKGIAFMNEPAWEGLVRKLLHAMMTSGDFFVVSAGPATSYLGNNFFQSSVMQFNYIMEPVLDKLGVRLISRNMGMDTSVLNSAFGGADIYGEADILMYQGKPETEGIMDFFHRQAILSGERVPVLLTPSVESLREATEDSIWAGNLQPGASFCSSSHFRNGTFTVPKLKACKYVSCSADAAERCDKHNSVCWVDRPDVSLEMAHQNKTVGWENKGLPNPNTQLLEGRKLAMLVLHALDEAIHQWTEKTKQGVLPLPNEMWHVGDVYKKVREAVRTTKGTECERYMRLVDRDLCHMELHAFTEWTPRIHPHVNRLKKIVTNKPIADNTQSMVEVYTSVDLLPPQWMPDEKDIDVHMVAIASDTNYLFEGEESDKITISDDEVKPPFNDYSPFEYSDWDYGFDQGYDVDTDDEYQNRRNLRAHRNLLPSEMSKQKTWTIFDAPLGFCDGSAQSRCNRSAQNPCLLANYNFHRAGIMGHGESGKLEFTVPGVKEGIIVARFDWALEKGPRVKYLPHDASIIFTVDGKETRHGRRSFAKNAIDLAEDVRFHVIMHDRKMEHAEGETKDVDVGIEVISHIIGSDAPLLLLTHIYYA